MDLTFGLGGEKMRKMEMKPIYEDTYSLALSQHLLTFYILPLPFFPSLQQEIPPETLEST